jgi:hypothetical protein
MNGTTNTSTATGNGGHFDPQQAAALLDQTTRQTRRALSPAQPWLLAIRAIAVLVVLSACWLNVRGQHPYHGPTFAVLPFVWGFVVINFIATVGMRVRATEGISGKSRLRPWEIIVLALGWLAVLPVIGGLAAAGASSATAYSLIPLTVPLILGGLAWAGINAARADWRPFGVGAGVAVVGAIGLFAGPVGAWVVDGVGLCIVLLGAAVAIVWQQHRSMVRS